jgi:hypothetical protein
MSRSIKAQISVGTRLFCVSVAGLAIGVSAAVAQTAPQTGAAPTATVRPPVARQIEPMVSPVKRAAPKVATPPLAATLQPAATPPHKTSPPIVAGAVAPAALASAQQPSTTPKIVVHTCKIGQDYSEKLKSCFTLGVTKVASAAKAVKAKIGADIETAKRSALGAVKRKQ